MEAESDDPTPIKFPQPPPGINRSFVEYLTWKDNNGNWVHGPFSNFYIEPDGTNIECEYQASKFGNRFRQKVILGTTPGRAKKLGRGWKLTREEVAEWDRRKYAVMADLLRTKYTDHPYLAEALMMTGKQLITEMNTWHDRYWGQCECKVCRVKGQNNLGKILMDIRFDLLRGKPLRPGMRGGLK